MANISGKYEERGCAQLRPHTPSIPDGQRSVEFKMMELQYVALEVFYYLSSAWAGRRAPIAPSASGSGQPNML
jgi:hypothetical protein